MHGNNKNRQQSRADRLNEAKQVRDRKRQEVIHAKRMIAAMPPRVVAVMPMSGGVDLRAFWSRLVAACGEDAGAAGGCGDGSMEVEVEVALDEPLVPRTLVAGPQKKVKLTLVPSLNGSDPLAVIDVAKSADVLLCLLSGDGQEAAIDAAGEDAIRIMRSLGLPSVLAVTQTPEGAKGANVMKARSAAKKRATDALSKFVPAESYKVMAADTGVDFKQIVRHITDSSVSVPGWRQQRSHIIAEQAVYDDVSGSLLLTGYVRHKGLTAQQLIHVPGAGDFQIAKIEAAEEPVRLAKGSGGLDAVMGGVIAVSAPEEREPLVRENEVDPLDADVGSGSEGDLRTGNGHQNGDARMDEGDRHEANWLMNDGGTDIDPDEFNKIDLSDDKELARTREEDAARRAREADDALYPDEFELHHGEAARRRLAKFRGLKSFRTSPWDPREDLPLDYAKVFAFENFRRAQKRAIELSNKVNRYNGPVGADVGAYVRITIPGVSQVAGRATVERVNAASGGLAPLLSAWGLLQHEVKMSVLNFSVRKEIGVTDPIANKEELLFVTGTRTYPAKPIYSTDEHGADKHKMERFLHDGRMAMATIYGPITYPPSPLLAFKRNPFDGSLRLVATGSLKSCDPDRVIIKKIVLTGFPVKTHRSKAIVRSMFFAPEDIRWFSPVELWTKLGRRGRIREPLGTHGLYKAIFDGPLSQQDTVCLSLYKRAFPKAWDDGRLCSA